MLRAQRAPGSEVINEVTANQHRHCAADDFTAHVLNQAVLLFE
jgi:hypothetical protein